MNVQRPLFWSQGILLQPQHFQLLDRNCQGLLSAYRRYLGPDFWGVGALKLNRGALAARTLAVEEGEFIFPDGTYVSLAENGCIEARSFDSALPGDGRPLTVYLGLKRWRDSGENVTVLPEAGSVNAVHTRFVTGTEPEEVGDLHAGGATGQVQRMHLVLRLFWESELDQLGEYQVIPLARVERSGAEIRLREDFIPPCLSCSGSTSLGRLIREIRDQVTARGRQLEEYKTRRGIHSAEFGSRDMAFFLALRSVNRYLPLLFHYSESRQIHPWLVYGMLRQLAGELSAFSERVNALGEHHGEREALPEYNHQNLWLCFSAARKLISLLLDEITAGPEYVVDLVHDGTCYGAELKPSLFEGRNRFYLAVTTEENPQDLLQSLEELAKLSSPTQLDLLVARSLPGIGLQYLQIPPQELPRRSNTHYFAIDHRNEQWEEVAKERGLALYWMDAPAGTEIQLMTVGR